MASVIGGLAAAGVMIAASMTATSGAAACGATTNCTIDGGAAGERHYRIRMPRNHDGRQPVAALIYAHGYTGSARNAMRSSGFAALASELGVALVATKSASAGWTIPGSPHRARVKADELAYYDRVLDDMIRRFPIDPNRIVATGFSEGGMMVWNLACHRSERFRAFIPVAGTFWQPAPETCTTPPANIIHIHGTRDPTVPLAGRQIRRFRQGDVRRVLENYADFGGYRAAKPVTTKTLSCSKSRNGKGTLLALCLFDGGHTFKPSFIGDAWQMLVAAGRL